LLIVVVGSSSIGAGIQGRYPGQMSGSTIRLGPTAANSQHDFAMYFICSTSLVDSFAVSFGDTFTYEANRALLFGLDEEIPHNELRECVSRALTYHLNKV
jgi:hypothetical protein